MSLNKPNVLIIDDDPSTIRLIGELLSSNYNVSFATDSDAGLELACTTADLDLILLDIKMPGADGYSLCRILKQTETTKRVPVIFVTSCTQDFEEAFGFRIGAVDYITKPISPEVLKARVKTHVTLFQQAKKLEELSSIDSLTSIGNRRKFDVCLDNEWKSSTRSKSPLSIILLDVDNFKSYNDTYGHGMGDKCLEKIGRVLKQACRRSNDLAARIGGEEFAILLPNTDQQGAKELAHQIRNKILELKIPHKSSHTHDFVSASIGVSTCLPSPQLNPTLFYSDADQQMYQVKNSGRNNVACHVLTAEE